MCPHDQLGMHPILSFQYLQRNGNFIYLFISIQPLGMVGPLSGLRRTLQFDRITSPHYTVKNLNHEPCPK